MWARNQHWVCSSIAFFELTTSAWLASQWALASTCPSTSSPLPSTAIIDVHALCLAFTWVLEIWPQVFMLTHHTFTCWIIISALQPFFKHFRSEWIRTHSLPVPWWPLFHSVIVQVKNWYIFKQSQRSVAGSHDLLESMQSLRGFSWQMDRPNYQESPSLTMNKKKSWNSLPTQSYTLKKN